LVVVIILVISVIVLVVVIIVIVVFVIVLFHYKHLHKNLINIIISKKEKNILFKNKKRTFQKFSFRLDYII